MERILVCEPARASKGGTSTRPLKVSALVEGGVSGGVPSPPPVAPPQEIRRTQMGRDERDREMKRRLIRVMIGRRPNNHRFSFYVQIFFFSRDARQASQGLIAW